MRSILARLGRAMRFRLRRGPRNQVPNYSWGRDDAAFDAPTLDEAPAPGLAAAVLDQTARAVVVIERIDRDGGHFASAGAFIDSRGLVVTNRHCVTGAASIKLNLGEFGLFDLPTLVAENETLDIAMLAGRFPKDAVGKIEWAGSTPHRHTPVAIVTRDPSGQVRCSPGWSGEIDFATDGGVVLTTTAPGWFGCSGSPLVDHSGRAVGVVNRFGRPITGQVRNSVQAALGSDVLALSLDVPGALAEWKDGDVGPEGRRYAAFMRAAKQLLHKHPVQSIEYLRGALKCRPNDTQASGALAHVLDQLNRGDDAMKILKNLIAGRPNDPVPSMLLAHRFVAMRRFAEAISAYRRSIKIRPSAVCWFWMGTAQWWQHEHAVAIKSFEEAVKIEPRHARSWEGLSRLYQMLNQPLEASRVLERRLEFDPDDAEVLSQLAGSMLKAGQVERHAEVSVRLSRINPYMANRAQMPPAVWPDDIQTENVDRG